MVRRNHFFFFFFLLIGSEKDNTISSFLGLSFSFHHNRALLPLSVLSICLSIFIFVKPDS